LEKNKEKDDKIREMKEKERRLLEQAKQKDEYVAKLKERISMLEQDSNNPSSHLQEKYDKLK